MDVEIRALGIGELPRLRAHLRRHFAESNADDGWYMPFDPAAGLGPAGPSARGLARAISEPGWQRCFAAFDAGRSRIVGHVDLAGDGLATGLHRCELGIGIERPYRSRGLGSRLMQVALGFARDTGTIAWVDLKVFAHNDGARRLYRRLGFVEVGTVSDRFRIGATSIDDVIMTLRLGAPGT